MVLPEELLLTVDVANVNCISEERIIIVNHLHYCEQSMLIRHEGYVALS
jgi:hypothetical protein